MKSDDTMNEETPVGVASAVKKGVTPSVVYMTVEIEKISSLEYTTVMGSFLLLSVPVTTTAGNAHGKFLYANVTGKPNGKKLNIHTLFTPGGNGIDVVVLVESIRVISERFANTTYGFFLGKRVAYLVVANYVRNTWGKYGLVRSMFSSSTELFSFKFNSMEGLDAMLENGLWLSYSRVMIELRVDVELKDNIVMAMPKIIGEGHYICNVHVEYEWKPPRCASCKVFRHIREECPKNTSAVEKETMRKPSQTSQELITSGQAILVDEAGNPLKKVEFLGDYDSEDEVASVDNDVAHSIASERDLPQELQAICDNLDI
nr:hypothetical protein [Tanacetum cinerariifolium]